MNRMGTRTLGTLVAVLALGALGGVAAADPSQEAGGHATTPANTNTNTHAADPADPAAGDHGAVGEDHGAAGEDHGAAGEDHGAAGEDHGAPSGDTGASGQPKPDHPEHPVHPDTPLPPAQAPAVGRRVNAGEVAGTVRVRLPGQSADVDLTDVASLPVGTVIDAREGTVELTSAADADNTPQTARFRGGRFTVAQRSGEQPVTELRLRGGRFAGCPRPRAHRSGAVVASASRARKVRSLWGSGHGHFRTRGRHSAATVRGTSWKVTDTCAGTRTDVYRGLVAVRDFKRSKTVMVPKGHHYVAR